MLLIGEIKLVDKYVLDIQIPIQYKVAKSNDWPIAQIVPFLIGGLDIFDHFDYWM